MKNDAIKLSIAMTIQMKWIVQKKLQQIHRLRVSFLDTLNSYKNIWTRRISHKISQSPAEIFKKYVFLFEKRKNENILQNSIRFFILEFHTQDKHKKKKNMRKSISNCVLLVVDLRPEFHLISNSVEWTGKMIIFLLFLFTSRRCRLTNNEMSSYEFS
jgi:uncharacterized FlgJ-related protein